MIQVSMKLIDGSLQVWSEDDHFISHLNNLQNQGYDGKALIHELITDDWAAPPVYVYISGETSEGSTVNTNISYD